MCGKTNPEEAENCLFCGAKLSGGDVFNPQEDANQEGSDWLSGLRPANWQSDDSAAPADDEPAEPESELPDWLSRVRARSQSDETAEGPAAEESGESPAGEEPDWLKNLTRNTQQEAGSADDWLAGLGGETPTPAEEGQEKAPFEAAGSEWLSSLRSDAPLSEASDETPAEPSEAAPGEEPAPAESWMAGLAGWTAPADAEAATPAPETPAAGPDFQLSGAEPEEAATDWFAQLAGDQSETPPAKPEVPEWTSSSSDTPADTTGEESDLPAWLGGIAAAGAGAAAVGAAGAAQEPEQQADLPDWLSRATPGIGAEEPAAPADEMPDWLKNPEQPAGEPVSAEQPAEPSEGLPDWLGQFGAETGPAAEANLPETPAEEAAPAGDLFTSFAETPPEAAAESSQPAPEGAEIPDFSGLFAEETSAVETPAEPAESIPDFSGLFAEQAASEGLPAAEAPELEGEATPGLPETPEGELPDWLQPAEAEAGQAVEEAAGPAADLPAWMKDFGAAGDQQEAVEPLETSSPFVEEGLPAWLDGVKPPADETGEPGVSALIEPEEQELTPELNAPFQVELPEWMDEKEAAEAGDIEAEPAAGDLGEGLEKAELPSWVEDLRPLESVIPGDVRSDTGEMLVEKAGPLAGMRGVLQGEDLTARYRKPPVYSARLRVSDRQRSQAAILENVLGVETSSREVPAEISRAPQFILRLIIALLLILSLLTMLLPDFRLVNVPAAYPAGLTGLYNQVENLPADAAVLLAVDYEPGLSGEMRYAASSVVEHLMTKNARLAIVSTVPTGPVLADEMLAEVRNRRPEYVLADRTVNLGYLPGGTTSLLEFAQDPRRSTPYAIDTPLSGVKGWDHAAVSGVRSLQDFSLVIVLTDSPETGRAWIEQVQPVLGSVPLMMVTSAQAGPMLQPYFDSSQIQGMVVGLQGGAMYEQMTGRVNQANRFYGAYQTGILVGLLLLILGGIISGVMGVSTQKQAQKSAQKGKA